MNQHTSCLLLLLALVGARANAQEVDDRRERQFAELYSLKPASRIRLVARSGNQAEGRLSLVRRDTLFLSQAGGSSAFPFADVDALWVRGRATKGGAIAGAIAGGVGVGIFFNLLCKFVAAEPGSDCNVAIITTVGTALGGAGGAVFGATLGAAFPRWHLRFQSANYDQRKWMKQSRPCPVNQR